MAHAYRPGPSHFKCAWGCRGGRRCKDPIVRRRRAKKAQGVR